MYSMKVIAKNLTYLLVTILLFTAYPVFASDITIRPFLIDETLSARGISQKLVTIKSDYTHRKAVLYATVNEISVDNEGVIKEFVSPVMTDRTTNVASWVEITRGRIEVPAGEIREIPITLKIHPFAEPGEYHVFVGFVEAPNRPTAESIAMKGEAKGVIVKITVSDDRKDTMRISGFLIDKFITGEDNKKVSIQIDNDGDVASAPTGEIILYDSRGVEIDSFLVNKENKIVQPGETITLEEEIPLDEKIGRFKANLSLRYGENQTASLQDTTYFYMLPMKTLVIIFCAVLLVASFIALLFRRVFFNHEEDDGCDDVTMYVKSGHEAIPQDHDIDLKNK